MTGNGFLTVLSWVALLFTVFYLIRAAVRANQHMELLKQMVENQETLIFILSKTPNVYPFTTTSVAKKRGETLKDEK
ncbi:YebO family protein [Chimaeribacter arupi]|uniref:YebO family protein n=1 Tax=Chimaeribacter arupi TaxID=2060066 RepID=UPI002946B621|nr:YebO family protein [Chimaeribacter arupi]MDV5139202.1 YebO family protein [Chimaeribacter arupi]